MSSKLPILLALAGVAYFISTASGEEGDVVGCTDAIACNYDDTATVDSGDCKYGDACDDDDPPYSPGDPCDNLNTSRTTVVSFPMTFDSERTDDDDSWSNTSKCYVANITLNQQDYTPGSRVNIEFDAQVRNVSKSRCGEGWFGVDRACKFAPTTGWTVGGNDGHLRFEIEIVPHGGTVPADSEAFDGNTKFWKYSNQEEVESEDPPSPCVEKNECSVFKDQWAIYQTSLTIPSTTTSLGSYDIIIKSGLKDDWNSEKFRGIAVIPNAFNVEECETPSEAENYETRFMSNQSFMTL